MKTSCFGDRKANKNWTLLSQWSIYAVAMNAVYDPWPFYFRRIARKTVSENCCNRLLSIEI
jgi:hypothetical protein